MKRYKKNEKDYEQFRYKEIEVIQYNGSFDDEDAPKWVKEALECGELFYDNNILILKRALIDIKDGYFIAYKLPDGGIHNLGVCTEEFLNENYDEID